MLKYKSTEYTDGERIVVLPESTTFSDDTNKYIKLPWMDQYSWNWLGDTLYGDPKYAIDLLSINNILDPLIDMNGKEFLILKPEYFVAY